MQKQKQWLTACQLKSVLHFFKKRRLLMEASKIAVDCDVSHDRGGVLVKVFN